MFSLFQPYIVVGGIYLLFFSFFSFFVVVIVVVAYRESFYFNYTRFIGVVSLRMAKSIG